MLVNDAERTGLDGAENMTTSSIHAVSMRSAGGAYLLCRLKRAPSGIYYLIPRDDPDHDVHASYHVDGKHHVKSYGSRVLTTIQRQRLDGQFRGAEPLFAQAILPGEESMLTIPCDPGKFDTLLEIDAGHFTSGVHHTLAVDLVEP